jgi:hypothetical protein
MKIISHRGNLIGPNPELENNPLYVEKCISYGFEVEVDVWYDKNLYLGHDTPQYKVDLNWIKKHPLWCHCKNKEALSFLLEQNIHCFWHENDAFTLTNKGIPWCYPNNWIKNGITVILKNSLVDIPNYILGICVDNPLDWIKK